MIHAEIDMNVETITAICVVIIALLALVVTLWQLWVARKHNRLSVRPFLVFHRNVNDAQPRVQIVLHNAGIGPAFTKDSRITLDGKIRVIKAQDLPSLVSDLGFTGAKGTGIIIDREGALAPKESLTLLTIETQEEPLYVLPKIYHLDIEIYYESAYGEKFTVQLNSDLT